MLKSGIKLERTSNSISCLKRKALAREAEAAGAARVLGSGLVNISKWREIEKPTCRAARAARLARVIDMAVERHVAQRPCAAAVRRRDHRIMPVNARRKSACRGEKRSK